MATGKIVCGFFLNGWVDADEFRMDTYCGTTGQFAEYMNLSWLTLDRLRKS